MHVLTHKAINIGMHYLAFLSLANVFYLCHQVLGYKSQDLVWRGTLSSRLSLVIYNIERTFEDDMHHGSDHLLI